MLTQPGVRVILLILTNAGPASNKPVVLDAMWPTGDLHGTLLSRLG